MNHPQGAFAFACMAAGLALWLPCCGEQVGALGTGDACSDEGAVEPCYGGPPTTRNVGPCAEGTRECKDGWWGECVGEVGPTDETCDDELDNDCNGTIDDGCPCLSGQVRDCYDGPSTARGVGICVVGQSSCVNEVWSTSCEGQVLPLEDDPCNGLDDDCNGATDEACICTLAGSYCDEEGNPALCPAGSYQPEPGQPACIESGQGFYVDQPGATAPTPCPEEGYYCPNAANVAPSSCPAGSYTNTNGAAGASTCAECPSGSYCKGDGARHDCADGMGAPPGSTASSKCGCHVRLTICVADCSNWPSGCAYGSTQWMEGFGPGDFFCIPDTDWGHGRESLDCEY